MTPARVRSSISGTLGAPTKSKPVRRSVEECRARLDEYRAAGVQLTILAPLERTMDLAIDALA